MLGGAMYAQYRLVNAADALVRSNGATPTDGASCFVNPLTSLGMTETMRREGHTALVHTAAASNLGQMLNKICVKDKILLVNIVRNEETVQRDVLASIDGRRTRS
jgi:NADPH2:quinone reductase